MTTITTTLTCECPGCKRELDAYLQELHPKSTRTPSMIGTCRNTECRYFEVTLAFDGWYKLATDTDMQAQYAWLAVGGAK